MIKKHWGTLFFSIALILSTTCASDTKKSTSSSDTSKPETSAKTTITHTVMSDDNYELLKENIEMAITDRGLIISGTLHISDMLNRTGKDLGYPKNIYKKAEGIEFCSAKISHAMAQVDPTNVSMCPFTIVIYQLADDPAKTHLSYRYVPLQGKGADVEKTIHQLLQGIVDEAIE